MRIRAAAVTLLLLLPLVLEAQRVPTAGATGRGRGPTGPQPLPPQPGPIARQSVFRRLPISFESYPLISYVQSPALAENLLGGNRRTSYGAGTRAEYRLSRHASATLDVTASRQGSVTHSETVELGTRLRPDRLETTRAHPYVDLRVGYVFASDAGIVRPFDVVDPAATPAASASRFSQGFGGAAGAGMEYMLTTRFFLTTGLSVLRSRMTAWAQGPIPDRPHYAMTAYRFTLGVKYNPVRMISPAVQRAMP
ncbi:MAG TPA: hypothetical protein VFT29_19900 [Gemmatimonadaceae bacterium]|nr:hypothetical protein [Gemmatimonadaceae bacterium]